MENRAHYILIGTFAIIVSAAMMLFALWFARASFNQTFAIYDVVFIGPVRGLATGGEVRFQGIKVGELTNLRLDPKDPNRVLARVRIDANTPVRTSTTAQLEPLGLTGVSLIQLGAGDPKDPALRPKLGQPPPQIEGKPGQFEGLLAAGESVALSAEQALQAVRGVLSPANVKNFSKIIADLEQLSAELAKNKAVISDADAAMLQVGAAADSIAKAAAAVETLSGHVDQRLEPLLVEVSGTLEQAHKTLAAVERTADTGTQALGRIEDAAGVAAADTLPELGTAAEDLRKLAASLNVVADELNQNPSGFLLNSKRPTVKVD